MAKYLDLNGLTYFGGKVKTALDTKAPLDEATTEAKGLMSSADKTKLDGFLSAENYALKSDIVNVYSFKGSVATYAELPTENLTAGDVYDVQERGINYAWTGTEWDALGEVFEIETITESDIDNIMS